MKISYKVLFAVVLATAGTNAFAADVTGLATTNYVKGALESLDATNNVAAGNYITAVNETDGKVSITTAAMDTTPTQNSTNPVTSGGVQAAIAGVSGNLSAITTDVTNLKAQMSEAETKISALETDNGDNKVAIEQHASDIADNAEAISELQADVSSGLGGKVDKAQGATNANKAMITDDQGNVTPGTIVVGMIANDAVETLKIKDKNVTKAKLADDVQASLNKADNSVQLSGDQTIAGTKTFSTQPVSTTSTTYAAAANNALVTKGQVATAITGVTTTANGKVTKNTGLSGKMVSVKADGELQNANTGLTGCTADAATGVSCIVIADADGAPKLQAVVDKYPTSTVTSN